MYLDLMMEKQQAIITCSTRNGHWLIIIHAITKDCLLCDYDSNGYPISDIVWNCDTPRPTKKVCSDENGLNLITCKTLWLADSKRVIIMKIWMQIFFKWVSEKLVPILEKNIRINK